MAIKNRLLMLLALPVSTFAQSPGTFTAVGHMITPRFRHTSTLLPNGKVLIAGGFTVCYLSFVGCLPAAGGEIYDLRSRILSALPAIQL